MDSTVRTSLADHVLCALREEIIRRQYLGTADRIITEVEVANRFNVSKTPAREALNSLCVEGLLEKVPRKGYFIKLLTMHELKNLFQLRMILEAAIMELCAKKITDDDLADLYVLVKEGEAFDEDSPVDKFIDHNDNFHDRLAQITGNPYLGYYLKQVLNQLSWTEGHFRYSTRAKRLSGHRSLVDMLCKRDPELAVEHSRARLLETYNRLYPDADDL